MRWSSSRRTEWCDFLTWASVQIAGRVAEPISVLQVTTLSVSDHCFLWSVLVGDITSKLTELCPWNWKVLLTYLFCMTEQEWLSLGHVSSAVGAKIRGVFPDLGGRDVCTRSPLCWWAAPEVSICRCTWTSTNTSLHWNSWELSGLHSLGSHKSTSRIPT